MSEMMKGYKVFEPDWTCRGFQYTCPGIFKEDVRPSCCSAGFHFCLKPADCFNYYSFNPENHVAEVVALGEVDTESDDSKVCTNEIKIVREIPWTEVLELVNIGNACTGFCNSGNRNSGNRNSGDWNKTSFSNGCFNTVEPKIYLFNRPSDWTYRDWLNSKARYLLNQMDCDHLEWIWAENMTNAEKSAHQEHKTTGGFLRKVTVAENGLIWWRSLNQHERSVILNMPNFDKAIFKEITGIDVDKD